MPKTIKIQCPECQQLIEIDVESGKVLSHQKEPKSKASLEDFMSAQKHRAKELEEKFNAGVEKEKSKKDRIAQKFEEAMKNKDSLPEAIKPPIQWD